MSDHHLKIGLKIQELTQTVNSIVGAQLQKFRTLRNPASNSFLIHTDFYPVGRNLYWGRAGRQLAVATELNKKALKNQQHPLELYIRAHLESCRVIACTPRPDGWVFDFGERGQMAWVFRDSDLLTAEVTIPGRKVYTVTLPLSPMILPADNADPASDNTAAVKAAAPTAAEKKWQKLLDRVAQDQRSAQLWLGDWAPICQRLAESPAAWGDERVWSAAERALLREEIERGELPPFQSSHLGRAQDHLFALRRRQLKKVEMAGRRLAELRRQNPQSYYAASTAPAARAVTPAALAAPADGRPTKKPGQWVRIDGQLWARVGKSAKDNDELFKQAKDRDLWLHVRGYAGAHVWVARGQGAFPKKGELSEHHLGLLCQLALFNSKLRDSARGTVDFTERRHLKKIAGQAGQLSIQRSETRQTTLDPQFVASLGAV